MFAKLTDYFVQSFNELKKINWPKRSDVIRLTIIVIISTIVSMLIIAGIDWLLTQLVNYFVMK
jgi:preprotein translocase SecE subunit